VNFVCVIKQDALLLYLWPVPSSAIVQAIRRWLPLTETRVHAHVIPCRACPSISADIIISTVPYIRSRIIWDEQKAR
jgi:hypothetical protein